MSADWLVGGQGERPRLRWSRTTDAPLTCLELARESGEVLAADASGGLYLLDRRGQIAALSRGFHELRDLAWSDTGAAGAALLGETRLCRLNRQLKVEWSLDLPDTALAVAVDPHGRHTAASLAGGGNVIFDADRRTIAEFQTVRPLSLLRFLTTEPALIAAAEYGLLCRHRLDGTEVWNERLWSNVGDLAVTGDGRSIVLAAFSYGLQKFDGDGRSRGAWIIEGTPGRVSTSFLPKRLAAATLERHLYWLDQAGEVVWATLLPEDVCRLYCDPLGTGLICGFNSGRIVRLDWDA